MSDIEEGEVASSSDEREVNANKQTSSSNQSPVEPAIKESNKSDLESGEITDSDDDQQPNYENEDVKNIYI